MDRARIHRPSSQRLQRPRCRRREGRDRGDVGGPAVNRRDVVSADSHIGSGRCRRRVRRRGCTGGRRVTRSACPGSTHRRAVHQSVLPRGPRDRIAGRALRGRCGGHRARQAAARDACVRVKDSNRIALTTDQTAAAGSPPGEYNLGGRQVVSDGKVVRLEDGTLAGSAATMDGLVRRMAAIPGLSAARAIAMASTVPARVLGERGLGRLRAGACADVVVLDSDLRVRLTMVGGTIRFRI
ncbi:MAG: hypothetical protein E6J05_00715 [Chloroflexi bacterium]|nr:MAG: hypothetical protein E6J05_00715 [Chloroflexota bacterium]